MIDLLTKTPASWAERGANLPLMQIIEASFENGALHPLRQLPLREGETVGIVVVRRPDPARWNLDRFAKISTSEEESRLSEDGLDEWATALDDQDRR